jgi:hypothetical protein
MKKLRKSRHARLAAAVLAVGAFASLAGVGYAAGFVPFVHTSSPTAAQYPPSKVTICHHTHSKKNPFVTITVSVHALPAHLGHGDTVGPCPSGPTGPTGATGAVAPKGVAFGLAHKGQKGGKGHGSENAHAGAKNHGKGHANGHSSTHGQGKGHGQGHANGHSSTHGQGHGKGQGHGQGNHGQGNHGQGHGPTGEHGHFGGKGHGH